MPRILYSQLLLLLELLPLLQLLVEDVLAVDGEEDVEAYGDGDLDHHPKRNAAFLIGSDTPSTLVLLPELLLDHVHLAADVALEDALVEVGARAESVVSELEAGDA